MPNYVALRSRKHPSRRSRDCCQRPGRREIVRPILRSEELQAFNALAIPLKHRSCGLCHKPRGWSASKGLVQIAIHGFQIAHGGQPFLIWANQQRQILGHMAIFNRLHGDLFQR